MSISTGTSQGFQPYIYGTFNIMSGQSQYNLPDNTTVATITGANPQNISYHLTSNDNNQSTTINQDRTRIISDHSVIQNNTVNSSGHIAQTIPNMDFLRIERINFARAFAQTCWKLATTKEWIQPQLP